MDTQTIEETETLLYLILDIYEVSKEVMNTVNGDRNKLSELVLQTVLSSEELMVLELASITDNKQIINSLFSSVISRAFIKGLDSGKLTVTKKNLH